MLTLIDTHCHLDFSQYDADRDQVLHDAWASGVDAIITPSVDLKSCQRVLDLIGQYDKVFGAVGVHPNSSAGWQDSWIGELRQMALQNKIVAIGEIGLDYHRDHSPRQLQRQAFFMQLQLAVELGLPVIIHNRDASGDVLKILEGLNRKHKYSRGVLHSFSGDWLVAEQALHLGYFLGFTGPVTFKNAESLRSVASRVPLNRILVETDGPYLAPQRYRGKRNEPSFVNEVVAKLAELHGMSFEQMARQTAQNAIDLFRLQ